MYQLPTTVQVDGKEWGITKKGDFRIVLSVFEALNDPELPTLQEKTLAATLLFYQEFNVLEDIMELPVETYQELVEKMFLFINCNQLNVGVNTGRKILDWKQDEQLIMSAINSVARKEVRAEKYVHWFTFMGYYMAIGECPLSTVVSIRDKIARNKKLEKYEKEFPNIS